ncbi:MAG: GIY-YIG nuclease family protein [Oscillospiraceae bacterium]|jgi:hypothetical protein|nr:GIY-YIG nuclease family protein [Oscillospiraceae bacterium]
MKDKKELQREYQSRTVTGGVVAIKNTVTGKVFLDKTVNLQGTLNRFAFSQNTKTCIHAKLRSDWQTHGTESFVIEVLESLDKEETQSDKEFREDVAVLLDCWLEKIPPEELY